MSRVALTIAVGAQCLSLANGLVNTLTHLKAYTDAECTVAYEPQWGVDSAGDHSFQFEKTWPQNLCLNKLIHKWDGDKLIKQHYEDSACTVMRTDTDAVEEWATCHPFQNQTAHPGLHWKLTKDWKVAEILVKTKYSDGACGEGNQTGQEFLVPDWCKVFNYPGSGAPMSVAQVVADGLVTDVWYPGTTDCSTHDTQIGWSHGNIDGSCVGSVILSQPTPGHAYDQGVGMCIMAGQAFRGNTGVVENPFFGEKSLAGMGAGDVADWPAAQFCAEAHALMASTVQTCSQVPAADLTAGTVAMISYIDSWCPEITCGMVKGSFNKLYEGYRNNSIKFQGGWMYQADGHTSSPEKCCNVASMDAPAWSGITCSAMKMAYKAAECCGMPDKMVGVEHFTYMLQGRRLEAKSMTLADYGPKDGELKFKKPDSRVTFKREPRAKDVAYAVKQVLAKLQGRKTPTTVN